jgi:hypothetical protein
VFVGPDCDGEDSDTSPPEPINELRQWIAHADYENRTNEYGKHLTSKMTGSSVSVKADGVPVLYFIFRYIIHHSVLQSS